MMGMRTRRLYVGARAPSADHDSSCSFDLLYTHRVTPFGFVSASGCGAEQAVADAPASL